MLDKEKLVLKTHVDIYVHVYTRIYMHIYYIYIYIKTNDVVSSNLVRKSAR